MLSLIPQETEPDAQFVRRRCKHSPPHTHPGCRPSSLLATPAEQGDSGRGRGRPMIQNIRSWLGSHTFEFLVLSQAAAAAVALPLNIGPVGVYKFRRGLSWQYFSCLRDDDSLTPAPLWRFLRGFGGGGVNIPEARTEKTPSEQKTTINVTGRHRTR